MKTLHFRLTGTTPLLCHNAQLSMPSNPYAKQMAEVSHRKGKTEADLSELGKLEFVGGLYLDPKTKEPSLPATMLYGCLLRGARKSKEGKAVEAGVSFTRQYYPLLYEGPRTWEELYAFEDKDGTRPFVDQRMVVVQRNKVMRTRAIFNEWSVEFDVAVNDDVLNPDKLLQFWADAGVFQRIGDARVLGYGSFVAEQIG